MVDKLSTSLATVHIIVKIAELCPRSHLPPERGIYLGAREVVSLVGEVPGPKVAILRHERSLDLRHNPHSHDMLRALIDSHVMLMSVVDST